jgi:hypothetical protein
MFRGTPFRDSNGTEFRQTMNPTAAERSSARHGTSGSGTEFRQTCFTHFQKLNRPLASLCLPGIATASSRLHVPASALELFLFFYMVYSKLQATGRKLQARGQ